MSFGSAGTILPLRLGTAGTGSRKMVVGRWWWNRRIPGSLCPMNTTRKKEKKELYKMRIDLGKSVTLPNVIIFILWESQKKREKGTKNLFDVIAEKLPNLGKKTTSRSRRHGDLPSKSAKAVNHQDIL